MLVWLRPLVAKAAGGFWTVLAFTIPLPLWALVAAGVWVMVDKHSAVRKAVNKYVAQNELLAAEANLAQKERLVEALRERSQELAKQAETSQKATLELEAKIADAASERQILEEQVDDLLDTPATGSVVTRDILDRLR